MAMPPSSTILSLFRFDLRLRSESTAAACACQNEGPTKVDKVVRRHRGRVGHKSGRMAARSDQLIGTILLTWAMGESRDRSATSGRMPPAAVIAETFLSESPESLDSTAAPSSCALIDVPPWSPPRTCTTRRGMAPAEAMAMRFSASAASLRSNFVTCSCECTITSQGCGMLC